MELSQVVWRYWLIAAAVCALIGIPQSFLIFRHVSELEPVTVFAATLSRSLFLDFMFFGFAAGLAISWIMVNTARNMILDERLYVKESSRLQRGRKWRTKSLPVSLIAVSSTLALLTAAGLACNFIFKDAKISSLAVILILKAGYTIASGLILTWLTFRASARNQDVIRRTRLYKL